MPVEFARPEVVGDGVVQSIDDRLQSGFKIPDFPSSFLEYIERRRLAGIADTVFDLAQALSDATEAYWARKRLAGDQAKPNFDEENQATSMDDAPVVLFGGGFMTWKGLTQLRKFSFGRELLASGPYSVVEEAFRQRGVHYIEVWPKKGANTGDAEEDIEALAEAVDIADATSNGPKMFIGHSFYGEAAYLFVARHPNSADKIDYFMTGGSPLPDRVNSLVEAALVLFSPNTKVGRKQLEEGIEYLNSPDAKERKFVSIIARDDRIIAGPAPGMVVVRPTGHSAIFFNEETLDGAVQIATTGALPANWQTVGSNTFAGNGNI